MDVRERLAKGEFNTMTQLEDMDGWTFISLSKNDDPQIYRMWVKDLYGPNEEVVEEAPEEVIHPKPKSPKKGKHNG